MTQSNAPDPRDDTAEPAASSLTLDPDKVEDLMFQEMRLAAPSFGYRENRVADAKGDILGTLIWNPENVEGEVVLLQGIEGMGKVAYLDMLSDWIELLQREYDKAYGDFYGE